MSSCDHTKTSLYSCSSLIMVALAVGGRSFAIERARGASVVPTFIASSTIVVTRRKISILRSKASYAQQSSAMASSLGSSSRVAVSIGEAYVSVVSPTSISNKGTIRDFRRDIAPAPHPPALPTCGFHLHRANRFPSVLACFLPSVP